MNTRQRPNPFALKVICPTCFADIDQECQWPRGVPQEQVLCHVDPHASRVGLAFDRGLDRAF